MNKIAFWTVFLIVTMFCLTTIANILPPFFIAFILAYLLKPVIDKYHLRYKIPRSIVASFVFTLFLGSLLLCFMLLVPIIVGQFTVLVNKIPLYQEYIESTLVPKATKAVHSISPDIGNNIRIAITNFVNGAFSLFAGGFNNVWNYTMATINFMAIILLVPFILLHLLRDWPKMIEFIQGLFPLKARDKVNEILSEINNTLSGYFRGQLNVCLLLASFYSVGLILIGVDFALLLGILSGFLIVIPFIGPLIAVSLVMTISYFSFGITSSFWYVLALYVIGHFAEGYILSPKIIGKRIGLHPVLIVFSVLTGGVLFGFLGVLFAMPVAGIIKVLLKHLLGFYKSSKLYLDK